MGGGTGDLVSVLAELGKGSNTPSSHAGMTPWIVRAPPMPPTPIFNDVFFCLRGEGVVFGPKTGPGGV